MSPIGSRSSTPTGKTALAGSNGRQTPLYASPLASHSNSADLNDYGPPPSRYSSRPHSPPTSSPPSDGSEDQHQRKHLRPPSRISFALDSHRRRFDDPSLQLLQQGEEREREMSRRERSPLPRIQSIDSPSSTGMTSLDGASWQGPKRLPSPHLLRGRRIPGEDSTMSYDGDQLQPADRRESAAAHQRSNSTEGVPYKRWGPFTSPIPLHRLQRPHLSTSLSSSTLPLKQLDYRKEGPPSSPPIQPRPHRETPASLHGCQGRELNEQVDHTTYLTIGSKRKHSEVSVEHTAVVDSDVSATHSHFSSLAPPSSHLYGDMEGSRREMLGSATSPGYQLTGSTKTGSFPQRQSMVTQHDELEDEDDPEEAQESDAGARAFDGGVLAASQRKSCDRCFKMKTKCSRATPGTCGDGPCDGCVRRGFAEDCITSRPDFPYPRISLTKRPRCESSLRALLNPNRADSTVCVPQSIVHGSGDWRTNVSTMQNGKEGGEQPPSFYSVPKARSHLDASCSTARPGSPLSIPTDLSAAPYARLADTGSSKAVPNHFQASHLHSLATAELRDLSMSIAQEVNQRAQTTPARTPTVPSVSIPQHHQHRHSHTLQPSSQLYGLQVASAQPSSRSAVYAAGGLAQQTMPGTPMQLLPKAVGLPALHYFDQLVFPLLLLPALSSKVLTERFSSFVKPGSNNVLELAMAVGLQLQGLLLSSSDEGLVNTAEGRIFKAFLLASKQQPQKNSSWSMSAGQRNPNNQSKTGSDGRLSIESIKGWIEPARHRSKAKDIVKHVMLRRCFKTGLDYDDVVENILLAYFHLIRGDVGAYYQRIGSAKQQLTLMAIQQPSSEAPWSSEDIATVRASVYSMERMHPIGFLAGLANASQPPSWSVANVNSDLATLQVRVSDIAAVVQAESKRKVSRDLGVGVDQLVDVFRQSLPNHLQACINNDWTSHRSDTMAPSLRLKICQGVSFLGLVARQGCLVDAIEQADWPVTAKEQQDGWQSIGEAHHLALTHLSSTLSAFTILPQLGCLSQMYAAELTASAWSFVTAHCLRLTMPSSQQGREADMATAAKMEDCLAQLARLISTSEEREGWHFSASLSSARTILKKVLEEGNGGEETLAALRRFCSTQREAFTRLLMGDPWACAKMNMGRDAGVRSERVEQQEGQGGETGT